MRHRRLEEGFLEDRRRLKRPLARLPRRRVGQTELDINRIADPRIRRPGALDPDAGIDNIEHHAEGCLTRGMETFVRSALISLLARIDEQTGGIGVAIVVEHEVRLEPLHAHMPDITA